MPWVRGLPLGAAAQSTVGRCASFMLQNHCFGAALKQQNRRLEKAQLGGDHGLDIDHRNEIKSLCGSGWGLLRH